MNNEQKSEQQKAIRRFFIGSFFIALVCAAVVDLFLASMDRGSSDEVVWVFFYTFFNGHIEEGEVRIEAKREKKVEFPY